MKDILILEECIVCETSQTFLSLILQLVDVCFFVWLLVGVWLVGFFWLEKGSAEKILGGTPMSVSLLNREGHHNALSFPN